MPHTLAPLVLALALFAFLGCELFCDGAKLGEEGFFVGGGFGAVDVGDFAVADLEYVRHTYTRFPSTSIPKKAFYGR